MLYNIILFCYCPNDISLKVAIKELIKMLLRKISNFSTLKIMEWHLTQNQVISQQMSLISSMTMILNYVLNIFYA